MEKHEMKNPIMLITKGYKDEKVVRMLFEFKLNVFLDISNFFENRNEVMQIGMMKTLFKYTGINLINYYKIVIEGVNIDEKTIKQVTSYCN